VVVVLVLVSLVPGLDVVVVVLVLVSDEAEPLGLAPGAAVSFFCSHAASSAAPARMQMYFFIVLELRRQY
jgi:hypothetical protein